MELNGFMIGPEIKKLFKIKVVTPTARHPVVALLCPSCVGCLGAYESLTSNLIPTTCNWESSSLFGDLVSHFLTDEKMNERLYKGIISLLHWDRSSRSILAGSVTSQSCRHDKKQCYLQPTRGPRTSISEVLDQPHNSTGRPSCCSHGCVDIKTNAEF